MDIKWPVEQHYEGFKNGKMTSNNAVAGILSAISLCETDMLSQYQCAKQVIEEVCQNVEAKGVLCKMIDNFIEDASNHAISAMKAAAIVGGYKAPKPVEYDKAVKDNE